MTVLPVWIHRDCGRNTSRLTKTRCILHRSLTFKRCLLSGHPLCVGDGQKRLQCIEICREWPQNCGSDASRSLFTFESHYNLKGHCLYSHVSWAHSSHNRNYSAFINVQSDRQLNAVKMKTGPNTNPNPILITFLKWNTCVYIDILEGFYFGHNY